MAISPYLVRRAEHRARIGSAMLWALVAFLAITWFVPGFPAWCLALLPVIELAAIVALFWFAQRLRRFSRRQELSQPIELNLHVWVHYPGGVARPCRKRALTRRKSLERWCCSDPGKPHEAAVR